MNKLQRKNGFSLMELMIVVAIMAILLALGFPLYRVYARRAKVTEAISGLGHIRTTQISYRSINDTYLTLNNNPVGAVPTNHVPWGTPGANWALLGFELSRTRYQFSGAVGSTGNISSSFLLTAQSDLDANGAPYDTWTLDNSGAITHTDRFK